jgi:IS5 family transposase
MLPRPREGLTGIASACFIRKNEIRSHPWHTQQEPKYRELLRITGQVLESARQVVKKTAKIKGVDVLGHLAIDQLRQQITTYCDLGEKVIHQTRRRVLDGEQVPPDEKVYSIFESHTHLIKRGKQRQPVEFGHKVFLAESSQGLITDYQILDGNPADSTQVQASLDRHQQVFQHSPELYAGDRGFYSADNVDHCQQAGVSQVCIPQRGGQKTAEQEALERSRAFNSRTGNAFGWASRAASRCCFAAGG